MTVLSSLSSQKTKQNKKKLKKWNPHWIVAGNLEAIISSSQWPFLLLTPGDLQNCKLIHININDCIKRWNWPTWWSWCNVRIGSTALPSLKTRRGGWHMRMEFGSRFRISGRRMRNPSNPPPIELQTRATFLSRMISLSFMKRKKPQLDHFFVVVVLSPSGSEGSHWIPSNPIQSYWIPGCS